MTKRVQVQFTVIAAKLLAVLLLSCSGTERGDTVVLSAPFGPLAYPFLYMAEHTAPEVLGGPVELAVWRTPDQLRAMVAGGQADVYALPTNVAAVFHEKGVDLRLVNVSVWSVFWMVSTDSTMTSLSSFRGARVAVPFRGDMPHIVFETLARQAGIDPERDMELHFAGTPQEIVQQLLTGAVDHAVLAEPDVSVLMVRARERGGTRRFFRTVSLERLWGEAFGTGPEIPLGGTAVIAGFPDDRDFAGRFDAEYARAVDWCVSHPGEVADLVASLFPGVPREAVMDAMGHMKFASVGADDARPALETFFGVLHDANPATVGGRMPDDSFYRADAP